MPYAKQLQNNEILAISSIPSVPSLYLDYVWIKQDCSSPNVFQNRLLRINFLRAFLSNKSNCGFTVAFDLFTGHCRANSTAPSPAGSCCWQLLARHGFQEIY